MRIRSVWHYLVVAGCAMIAMFGVALVFNVAGLFFPVVSADLGIPTSALSLWMTVSGLLSTAVLPIGGRLLATRDARVVLSAAILLIALGMFIFSLASSGDPRGVWFFYIGALFIGPGTAMTMFLAIPTLINRWFARRTGTFLGVALAFTGVGGAIFNQVGHLLMESVGWQSTYRIFAALVLLGCLPFTLVVLRGHPHEVGLQPYGAQDSQPRASSQAPAPQTSGVLLRDAVRSSSFRLLLVLHTISYVGASLYHMLPTYAASLSDAVTGAALGAAITTFAMIGQATGKITLGFINDRSVSLGSNIALGCGLVSVVVLWAFPGVQILMALAGFIFGWYFTFILVQMPNLVRTAFGSRDFAQIYSRTSAAGAFASAVSPALLALVVERLGGFPTVFALVLVIIVGSWVCYVWALRAARSLARV